MTTAERHSKACKDFKEHFLVIHSYGYCEYCYRSDQSLDAHHIFRASEAPKHPNLHDFKNFLLLCRECHSKAHSGEIGEFIAKVKAERGLDELFTTYPQGGV